uniref:SUZ-C domain-containing protein n=1 Tax=Neogobius melanostomus TaxID=47308 RepID=A0A8C6TWW6_9GOBI
MYWCNMNVLSCVSESSINSTRSPLRTAMIRILKRPSNNGTLGSSLNQSRPTPSTQRHAREYWGVPAPKNLPRTSKPGRNNNSTLPSEDSRSNNHMVRQPVGPDGTQGFRQHR